MRAYRSKFPFSFWDQKTQTRPFPSTAMAGRVHVAAGFADIHRRAAELRQYDMVTPRRRLHVIEAGWLFLVVRADLIMVAVVPEFNIRQPHVTALIGCSGRIILFVGVFGDLRRERNAVSHYPSAQRDKAPAEGDLRQPDSEVALRCLERQLR
jgi:hypothetical protein